MEGNAQVLKKARKKRGIREGHGQRATGEEKKIHPYVPAVLSSLPLALSNLTNASAWNLTALYGSLSSGIGSYGALHDGTCSLYGPYLCIKGEDSLWPSLVV